jgi:hypothetical protein
VGHMWPAGRTLHKPSLYHAFLHNLQSFSIEAKNKQIIRQYLFLFAIVSPYP